MLLEDISPYLAAAKTAAKSLLRIDFPVNEDYSLFEDTLGRLCEKALVGTDLYFKVSAIVSSFSMNHELIKRFLDVSSKDEFKGLCGVALTEAAY